MSESVSDYPHEWSLAEAYLGVMLDGLCHSVELDPVETWRLPRWRDGLPSLYDRRTASRHQG